MESLPLPSPTLRAVTDPSEIDAEVLVVALTEDGKPSGPLAAINRSDRWIDRLMSRGQLRGKKGELSLLASPEATGPAMILVVGIGRADQQSEALAFDSAASAVRLLADRPRKSVVISLAESFPAAMHESIVAGVLFACEGQGIYQSEEALHVPATVGLTGLTPDALERGRVIGTSINQTRRLVNEPPAVIYPESFAARARQFAQSTGLKVEVWDEAKLKAEGCRAMLAVDR
ncbi:MAG: peptidase M17, partial [Pirellulales bacterium]|nr:peptidase M17 [Pirellulales bacterium]